MGLHTGEVISEEGDYFGKNVILAARIAAQALGGEILVSEELREAASSGNGERPPLRRRPRARAQGAGRQPPRLPRRVGGVRRGLASLPEPGAPEPLTPTHHEAAARVLADAFIDDPGWVSVGPRQPREALEVTSTGSAWARSGSASAGAGRPGASPRAASPSPC